ncbi:ureidoglycolate lyase [Ruegeria pomeroyi]|nr:ureidoglycolate lyase [Ruegeria pomeroyi]
MTDLRAKPMTPRDFARFGDVIARSEATADVMINQGRCGRFHDLADVDIVDGRAGISLFDSEAAHPPYKIAMVERHPKGSQAFIPLDGAPYLVVVAEDRDGVPTGIQAFVADGSQAVNIHRNVWHGVLTPMERSGLYAVVDRIGEGRNLEEHWFDQPFTVDTTMLELAVPARPSNLIGTEA